jgi:type I restriction enzyme S subunit
LEFRLPPVPEQGRIVAEIERQFTQLEAGVVALGRVQANLKRYRAAVLKAAVEGRLVPTEAELARREGRSYEPASELLRRILVERRARWEAAYIARMRASGMESRDNRWKGRYEEPATPDTCDLPNLPESWGYASVEQLNPPDRPCAYGVLQPGGDVAGGVPIIRVGDINNGRINVAALKRISLLIAASYPRTELRGGEVLLTLVGAIGRTAVVPEALKGANTARAVGVIPLSEFVKPEWVEFGFAIHSKSLK